MQQDSKQPATVLPALLVAALLAAPAAANETTPSSPQAGRTSAAAPATAAPGKTAVKTTTNKPVDAAAPRLSADDTPERIGTGGVVELTSLDPEQPAPRDTTVIPTELAPGTPIPPPKRAASTGRPLVKPAAAATGEPTADAGAAKTAATGRRDLESGSLGAGATATGGTGGSLTSSASPFMTQVVPTALALSGTIGAIFLARFAMRRFGDKLGRGKRPSGVVEVLARYPFARGHHIVLIKVGRRVLVTHQSAQGISTLSEFTSHADVADLIARCEAGARGTDQFSFDSLLRNSDREFDAPSALDRRPQKLQRGEGRSALPANVRGAEIETIDLTRRRGVAR